jgi:hypothetical protein
MRRFALDFVIGAGMVNSVLLTMALIKYLSA